MSVRDQQIAEQEKIARLGLTAAVFLEPAPADADEVQISHAALGADGHQMLRNEVW
jgi:hypothetical protein